jgi:hypothetical protein
MPDLQGRRYDALPRSPPTAFIAVIIYVTSLPNVPYLSRHSFDSFLDPPVSIQCLLGGPDSG